MTTQQTIPLNQLVASKANVRRTGKTEGIGELAASIAAHGLRQNLNVLPSADGKRFEVVAGGRRLQALRQLSKAGTLPKDMPVPCLVMDEGDDPAEISLVENTVRSAMHPDDQFEAFRALIEDKGLSVEDVAGRFGVTPVVVRQRLKLANVSPKLRALYRKGEMGLDHVMALAISDDHAAQEAAWKALPDWNREPSSLKDALTHDSVAVTDRIAKFVGVDAYLEAGGAVLRDLFGDEDEAYLSDRALLTGLAIAKMETVAAAVQAEGWKWVKPELTRDYAIHYGRVHASYDDDGDGATVEPVFAPGDMARAGARVSIDYEGTLCIERGLVHPDDAPRAAANGKGERCAKTAADPSGLSAAMVEDLTAHRTAALRIELTRNPSVALAATVHALAQSLLYAGGSASCLQMRAASSALDRHTQAVADCSAHNEMANEGERWCERLPGQAADLFPWCLDQPQDVLLDLLAFLAALTIDAVRMKHGGSEGRTHADRLAVALSLDMRQWWTPSVDGFYQRLTKNALAQAVNEAEVPLVGSTIGKCSKADAARVAATSLNGTGWLPEPLRLPSPAPAA